MAEQKKSGIIGSLLKVSAGLIVGAGAGFIAGVMLAPKAGKETREDVKSVSLKLKADANEKVNELKERSENIIRRGTSTLKIGQNETDELTADLPISTTTNVQATREKNSTESLLERIQGVTADNLD
ncbi:MAG: YtxH domain-containing protein [Culicoidibacterales bacterium]